MSLPYNKNSWIIDMNGLRKVLPNTPEDVLQQVYSDHGRKDEFQSNYKALEISAIKWHLVPVEAHLLASADMYEMFRRWFENVRERANDFPSMGWKCIDARPAVNQHWEKNHTWLTPPIFIRGSMKSSPTPLYLMEGHSRVGALAGLVRSGVIAPDSNHCVWLGEP